MADTDLKAWQQPKDASPTQRWIGWLIEKVGLPGVVIIALLYFGDRQFEKLGAKLDRLTAAVEAKK